MSSNQAGSKPGSRAASAAELVTIENFEEKAPARVNSPRTLEACLRQGVKPEELMPRCAKRRAARLVRAPCTTRLVRAPCAACLACVTAR